MSEHFLGNNNHNKSSSSSCSRTEGKEGQSSPGFLGEGVPSTNSIVSASEVQNLTGGGGSSSSGGGSSISSYNSTESSAPAPSDPSSAASSVISDASLDLSTSRTYSSSSSPPCINSDPTQVQLPSFTPAFLLSCSILSTNPGPKLAASSATSASSSSPSTPPNKSHVPNLNNLNGHSLFDSPDFGTRMSMGHRSDSLIEPDIATSLGNLSLRGAPLTPQMSGDSGIFAWNGPEETATTYGYPDPGRQQNHYQDDYVSNYSSQQLQQQRPSRAITGGSVGGSVSRPSPINSSSYSSSGYGGRGYHQMSPSSPIGRQSQDWSSMRSGQGGYPGQGYGGNVSRPQYPMHSTPNGIGYRPPKLNMPPFSGGRLPKSPGRPPMYDHLGEPPYSAPADPSMGDGFSGHRGPPRLPRPKNRTPFFPGNEYYNTGSMVDGSAGKFYLPCSELSSFLPSFLSLSFLPPFQRSQYY